MNVSYFDLTNDLKCRVLSPTNCTAMKSYMLYKNPLGQNHIALIRIVPPCICIRVGHIK